jgi:hypothetical protein
MTKEQDHPSIPSIQIVGKTLVAHMLSENFAKDRVTTIYHEADSIVPSAFFPQRNSCMVKQECIRDMITEI